MMQGWEQFAGRKKRKLLTIIKNSSDDGHTENTT